MLGKQLRKKEMIMKKENNDDMLPEYDFSNGIRGKYSKRYAKGTNVVLIEPDVFEYFPDQKSVNEALRSLANIIEQHKKSEQ